MRSEYYYLQQTVIVESPGLYRVVETSKIAYSLSSFVFIEFSILYAFYTYRFPTGAISSRSPYEFYFRRSMSHFTIVFSKAC